MKPIFQTSFYDPENESRGNCLHACIASIFEFDTPEQIDLPDIAFSNDVMNWTNKHFPGIALVGRDFRTNYQVSAKPSKERPQGGWVYVDPEHWYAPHYGYWIGSVYSPRAKRPMSDPYWPRSGLHAIVMKGYKMVHDPHPEGKWEQYNSLILNALYWVVDDPSKIHSY